MENKKNLVEETVIQIKNLEEVIAENAKGILQSTMAGEIKELVKESLTEQEDEIEEPEADVEMIDSDEDSDEELEDEDMMDMDADNLEIDDSDEFEDEEPIIDLTGEENPDEVLRVFQLMGPDDEVIVKKDDSGNISLKDNKNNTEYMIVGESEEEFDFTDEMSEEMYEEEEADDEDVKDIINKVFATEEYEEEEEEDESYELDEEDDIIYEIEMDEEEEESYDLDEEEEEEESYDLDDVMESKNSIKPKGVGIGKPKKVDYKSNTVGGFNEKKKEAFGKGVKAVGTGDGKKGFTYKDGENLDGEFKIKPKKKVEAKEAARTYGNGSKEGRGLRKGITPNRNLKFENVNREEIEILREKNEEYRKALNVFRDKLNEVAVFNSNLAYATRLFTEHTTTKQEKITILKRFDSVETIKESKTLYHTIKDELTNTKSQPMNESIERAINNTPSTGSAVNLIESKTYENPQFLRMKDLMSKLR